MNRGGEGGYFPQNGRYRYIYKFSDMTWKIMDNIKENNGFKII